MSEMPLLLFLEWSASGKSNVGMLYIIITISLLMSPLLGHMPTLGITHKKNGL
jgi:hypothetical protein